MELISIYAGRSFHRDLKRTDALLDQTIFAGVRNIIKNEVLFRISVHPESRVGKLPPRKLTELIKEARNYSFDFLEWKKAFELKKHWLAHTKKYVRGIIYLLKKPGIWGRPNAGLFIVKTARYCTNRESGYYPVFIQFLPGQGPVFADRW